MISPELNRIIEEFKYEHFVRRSDQLALLRGLASTETDVLRQADDVKLPRLGFVFETAGVEAFTDWTRTRNLVSLNEAKLGFANAYACWRSLSSLSNGMPSKTGEARVERIPISTNGLGLLGSQLPEEGITPSASLSLRMAIAGLVADRTAEVRLELERFDLSLEHSDRTIDWKEFVLSSIANSLALLVRKRNAWEDINLGLGMIDRLRAEQKSREGDYLGAIQISSTQKAAALELVGLYNLAQIATLTADYLRTGSPEISTLRTRIDRHHERAEEAFAAINATLLSRTGDLIWIGCRVLVENSLWSHIQGLGEHSKEFAEVLLSDGRPNPVLELWPAQQEALKGNLLDPYRKAVLVQMPTSSGKTLLAKFMIVQTKALNPSGVVAYVVPTRALVNQITMDLRNDLSPRLRVEQAIPVFELDPTEEQLLNSRPDVIVTTPEKLDLLVRRDHISTKNLVLVVADEVHNLADDTRGARLELLLGTIRRDRGQSRFLMLSPFLPNGEELVTWLGDGKELPPITVNWKPGRKIVGALRVSGKGKSRRLLFETLPAAANTDVEDGLIFPVGPAVIAKTKSNLTIGGVRAFAHRGGVLILCRGQGTAQERAMELAESQDPKSLSPEGEAVCEYITAEAGTPTSLVDCIKRGVAYHHAGMSQETRWLVENLIRKREINVICGTTTLAQGVNFPISTVLVETLKKGKAQLTYQDFWNIAGRAGRTLMDSVGVVAFPESGERDRNANIEFLRKEADSIASQLASVVERASDLQGEFNMKTIVDMPALSPLLQFLAHALRVAGEGNLSDEVEDVLRSSLVYHQARRRSAKEAQKLVELCRAYLVQIQMKKGILPLADKTGFSTPSVLSLLARSNTSEMKSVENWLPEHLFGENITALTERIDAVAQLPEITLGSGTRAPFSPERVAKIIRDWVGGKDLQTIANTYFAIPGGSSDIRLRDSNRYIFSTLCGLASWGLASLATVSLPGANENDWKRIGHVPSMVYYGVKSREAVWLRMVGIPRILAEGLSKRWREQKQGDPNDYDHIRNWVKSLSDSDWNSAVPTGTSLDSLRCRTLWGMLSGVN